MTCEGCGEEFEHLNLGLCPECGEAELEAQSDFESDYENDLIDGVGFADPGGNSALRAATPDNPRVHPCPTCGAENTLTPIDVSRGYQCDRCADALERGF
jgi:hypothetical protein